MIPWVTLYLRSPDVAYMNNVLYAAQLSWADPETGERRIGGDPHIIRLKLLPDLTEPTGVTLTDVEGNSYPEMAAVPGYHVNVLVHPDHEAAYRTALADVLIDPAPETPLFEWAR